MRPSVILLRLAPTLLAAACSAAPGPAPAPPSTVIAIAPPIESVAPSPPPAPVPPLDPSLPAGAAALASVDVTRLEAVAAAAFRAIPAEDRAIAERALRLGDGALGDARLARVLGLDPARSIVASASLAGAKSREALDALRALGTSSRPVPNAAATLQRALADADLAVAIRVVLPTTGDGAIARAALASLLERIGWSVAPPPDGVDEVYVDRHQSSAIGITRGAGVVVVDVVIAAGDAKEEHDPARRARKVLAAIRLRDATSPREDPLPTDGHVARLRYVPARLADLSFLQGVSATSRALVAVDDAHRDELAAEGLREAAMAFVLAASERGAFVDRIEGSIDGLPGALELSIRAAPGPATKLDAPSWAPSAAVTIPGTFALLDLSLPWLRAASFPVGDLAEPRKLRRAMRDAGWAGPPIALPQVMTAASWDAVRSFVEYHGALARFERIGVFTPAEHERDGHLALLPAGTSADAAACALVRREAPCTAKDRLRPGATVQVGDHFARLFSIKGRWVIVASRDKALVDRAKPELVAAPAGPARAELPTAPLGREMRAVLVRSLVAERYVVEALLEGGEEVLRVKPVVVAGKKP